MKHTPGPWIAIPDAKINEGLLIKRKSGKKSDYLTINFGGNFSAQNKTGNENEANARLIAAAPEMLEALEAVRATLANISPHELSPQARKELSALQDRVIIALSQVKEK